MRSPSSRTLSAFFLLCAAASAPAQITYTNVFPGVTFNRPVWFGQMPGVPDTTFVILEQHVGKVTLMTRKNGAWIKSTMLTWNVNQANEQGLLGIAFHPDYKNNHKYYISYDTPENYNDVISERIADSSLKVDTDSNRVLISLVDPYDNHNGGTIGFGPKDGYLYWSMGDGGSQYDPNGNGQNTNVLFAKLMRIDVNKKDAGKQYSIPPDNPFAGGGGRGEIFAYGLRNPWKWSFDALTGQVWLGDVGQDNIEEVDTITKGGNYGWSAMEGPNGTNNGSMILPIFSYNHGVGNAVIGGIVYRANPDSKYYGAYFVSDNGTKAAWVIQKNGSGKYAATTINSPPDAFSSFGTDAYGRIYGCGLNTGIIYRMDSPDLGAAPTALKPGMFSERMCAKRAFTASPGGSLAMEAFGAATALELHLPNGRLAARVTRKSPHLPQDLKRGVYMLEADGAPAGKLMVR